MAQYRQSGTERFGARVHDVHPLPNPNGVSDLVAVGIRSVSHKQGRTRRSGRSGNFLPGLSIGVIIVVLALVLVVTVLAYRSISGDTRETISYHAEDDEFKNDLDFLANVSRTESHKVLKFGHGSVVHGRDSRYWDKDDRRRDEDYNEDVLEQSEAARKGTSSEEKVQEKVNKVEGRSFLEDSDRKGIGLYNEAGRNELKMYEAEYEASLQNSADSQKGVHQNEHLDGHNSEKQSEADDYDDGIDYHGAHLEDYDDSMHEKAGNLEVTKSHDEDGQETSGLHISKTKNQNIPRKVMKVSTKSLDDFSELSQNHDEVITNSKHASSTDVQSSKRLQSNSKKKAKRRKFSGSCTVKFLNSTSHLIEPLESRNFARFSLQYTEKEDKPDEKEQWEPRFAGHQSWQERENSFLARDQKINCGFVRGPEGSASTGFDLAEDDLNYISRCHIAVISCIFGNSDHLRAPTGKAVTRLSKKNVCFVMFIDEITLQMLSLEGQTPDRMGFIGLWRIVVVKNLPHADMRRVGKIPKLLPHRLFPSARYSIWLDSKLRLQHDPLLILEYFLWRKGYEYAISNHYDRHCVWEEVAQNKKLNKFNHTIIDQQFTFYQADGLTKFNASDPNKLLPSNVPEGSFIIRAHTPMSNLFSCLWFNEVDRFTPRDQLSFAYTYQKLTSMNPGKPLHLNMFKDCERRVIAKLYHHRSQERRSNQQKATE